MERIWTSREKFAEDWGHGRPDVERVVFFGRDEAAVLEYIFTDAPVQIDTVALAEVGSASV